MFKIKNVVTNAVREFETPVEAVKFLADSGVTKASLKSIEKAANKAIKSGDVLYETFKIEEEVEMTNQVAEVEVENKEVAAPAEENVVAPEGAVEEVVEEVSEDAAEKEYLESEEAAEQVEKENEAFADMLEQQKKGDDKKPEEKSENKRRVGKVLIAYENGVEKLKFPSIKAAATHFKESMNLKSMPFTPIMKSARQGVDWGAWSFKFENPTDLHIPVSMRKKEEEVKKDETPKTEAPTTDETKVEEQPTAQQDEVIEEIVEEVL